MKKILYIYGFGSSVESTTYTWLKSNLTDAEVYSFIYDQLYPKIAIDELIEKVEDYDIDIVIGSSLGGWYAMHVSALMSKPCLLINPVTDSTIKSTIDLVSGHDEDVVNRFVDYSSEHPLFATKEHWMGYLWDEEEADYSIMVWSDHDEVIKSGRTVPKELSDNIGDIVVVEGGMHSLNTNQKKRYVLPAYDKLVNEIIPSMNNFYQNTDVFP